MRYASYKETPAYRNRNPLNIRWSAKNKWQGQTGCDARGFAKFESLSYGYRAAVKILRQYRANGWKTIAEVIRHWAPPSENNTESYVNTVCKMMSARMSGTIAIGPQTEVDLKNRNLVVTMLMMMTRVETGWNTAATLSMREYIEMGYDLVATSPEFFKRE
jgi:hypothetical protein